MSDDGQNGVWVHRLLVRSTAYPLLSLFLMPLLLISSSLLKPQLAIINYSFGCMSSFLRSIVADRKKMTIENFFFIY